MCDVHQQLNPEGVSHPQRNGRRIAQLGQKWARAVLPNQRSLLLLLALALAGRGFLPVKHDDNASREDDRLDLERNGRILKCLGPRTVRRQSLPGGSIQPTGQAVDAPRALWPGGRHDHQAASGAKGAIDLRESLGIEDVFAGEGRDNRIDRPRGEGLRLGHTSRYGHSPDRSRETMAEDSSHLRRWFEAHGGQAAAAKGQQQMACARAQFEDSAHRRDPR